MKVTIPIRTSSCPHCGGPLTPHADDDYLYGSPIQTCPKCGKQYLDKHYHEAEIDGFHEADVSNKAVGKEVLIFGACALVLGLLNVLSFSTGRIRPALLLFFILAVVVLFSSLKKAAKVVTGVRKKELEKERQASALRLQDKTYAFTLKELGYTVPEKYLQ